MLVTDRVAAQLDDISRLDVVDFVPRRASSTKAVTSIPLSDQLAILAHAVQSIIGYAITDRLCQARLEEVMQSFNRGVTKLRGHALDNYDAARIANLLNSYLEGWSSALFRVGMDARRTLRNPPTIAHFPPVVVLTWEKLSAYINTSGLMNVAVSKPLAKRHKMQEVVERP